jgi:hypothetical protein
MPEAGDPLLLEFLGWVASQPRTYADAMEAWRSSCPRHSIWEDALLNGLVEVESAGRRGQARVKLTARGKSLLQATKHSGK